MKTFDIVVLTDSKHAYPTQIDAYIKNVITEDGLLLNALGKLGLKAVRIAWNDPNFDWTSTKSVIFRSTWDYFYRFEAFSTWLNKVSQLTQLFNSETLIRWNLDKHYLQDLNKTGVNIPETYFIEQGSTETLLEIHKKLDWDETVLKPCVSGTSRHTYKLQIATLNDHEAILKELVANEAMMLQPFQKNIVEKGEVSMMLFNGKFTHAVLKKAKVGDFRVQDDFGGTVHEYSPTEEEIKFAENVTKSCLELPIYARVDIFTDNYGKLAIAELEIIEPELWFRFYPDAANVLANAIKNRLADLFE